MWNLFPKMYHAFSEWGPDFLSNILVPMDNYISKSTQVFVSGEYLQMVLQMYHKAMTADLPENITGEGAKLIEVVLLNCGGYIDNVLENIVELALNRLSKAKNTFLKVLLLEVVVNSLYYNPPLLLNILEKRGWTQEVFSMWFTLIPKFKRLHDRKISIVALSSLFRLPIPNLPSVIQLGFKQIIETLISLVKSNETEKDEIAAQKSDDEEEEEDEQEQEEELNENDEENQEETVEQLAHQVQIHFI